MTPLIQLSDCVAVSLHLKNITSQRRGFARVLNLLLQGESLQSRVYCEFVAFVSWDTFPAATYLSLTTSDVMPLFDLWQVVGCVLLFFHKSRTRLTESEKIGLN